MKTAQTVVIERDAWFDTSLTTEPFEAGWATEALWFINVLDSDGSRWVAIPEISPDGANWISAPAAIPLSLSSLGVHALPLDHFGVWLRLTVVPTSTAARLKLRVTLSLK